MTTPDTLTANPPRPQMPMLFPPSFLEVVDSAVRTTLERAHPGVSIDPHSIWLNRENGASLSLHDSLIKTFLGRLIPENQGRHGWFSKPYTLDDADLIPGLNPEHLRALYTTISATLIDAYTLALTDYWGGIDADGKNRKTLFLDQRIEALRQEASVGVEQRNLTLTQGTMLETMLRYSQNQSADALQQHGLYSLSLSGLHQPAMTLAGCFVLSDVCTHGTPAATDARQGQVLLYTPNRGLEGFAAFPALNESLSRRLDDPVEKQWLLKSMSHQDAAKVTPTFLPTWHYTPMSANFLDLQLSQQLLKQQSDFAHCVDLAKIRGLDQQGFLALLAEQLDPRYQFDNYLNLDRNEKTIVHGCMPDWWQALSVDEKSDWLASAKTYGSAMNMLIQTTEAQRRQPELDSKAFIETYLDDLLKTFLSAKQVALPSERLSVEIIHYSWPIPPAYPFVRPSPVVDSSLVRRYSLKALAYETADTLRLSNAYSLVVRDPNNAIIPQLGLEDIKALVAQIDIDGAFDRFLNARLKTSAYSQTLRMQSDLLALAQMRLGLRAARREGLASIGLSWIAAVLDAPQAATRRTVKSASAAEPAPIQVQFLKINETPLSNLMLIAPATAGERTAVVICTLNAPDGVVFRWFSNKEAFRREFLNNRQFTEYLLLQLPVAKRPNALSSIEVDRGLRQNRFPAMFRHLPQIVPLPALMWELETYAEPSPDFLAENYRIKLEHVISDAKVYWRQARAQANLEHSALNHLAISIALLFLPTPVMIPLALGIGLYSAWEGFREIDDHDYQGATREFLIALGYLIPAGIDMWSLSQDLPSLVATSRPAPPLVRRIGPDGQVHIGFLLSPAASPHWGQVQRYKTLDTTQFSRIEIDSDVLFINKRFNLFGHTRLYRQNPANLNLLMHSGEYGLRGKNGLWLKAAYNVRGTSEQIFRQARRELASLTHGWPTSLSNVSLAEKARFETDFTALASTANTDLMPEVLSYCEAGSEDINRLLRASVNNAVTRQFLRQFYQLNDYQGVAFRVTHVSTAGLQRLKSTLGLSFCDGGVQSASVSRFNAAQWSQSPFISQHATPDNHLVFLLFDATIPKKNLFSHLLGDHVGVAPGTPMQLIATQETGGKSFLYFTSPQELGDELFDVYSGERQLLV
jgi:hypothetical protein